MNVGQRATVYRGFLLKKKKKKNKSDEELIPVLWPTVPAVVSIPFPGDFIYPNPK